MNKKEAIVSIAPGGFFQNFMSVSQRQALHAGLRGEESSFFATMLTELMERIKTMPQTYMTDGQGEDAIVYLHYFGGPIDAWVTEKDMGDGEDGGEQHQAFGMQTITGNKGDAELGYVSIEQLIQLGIELDLYWTPKSLKEVMA